MNLKRLADEVKTEISEEMILIADGSERLEDYELDFSRELPVEPLDGALADFRGRDLTASDDAAMAIAVRRALPLTAREAADRNVWWWLSLRRFPDVVQRRWRQVGESSSLSVNRMLGQPGRNAFARLWWGAEMVQALPDPTKYTQQMFRNQDLFEAVIGRRLGRYPVALQTILDELSGLPGKEARVIVRDFGFLLSTLVLEAMEPDAVREEIRQLKAALE